MGHPLQHPRPQRRRRAAPLQHQTSPQPRQRLRQQKPPRLQLQNQSLYPNPWHTPLVRIRSRWKSRRRPWKPNRPRVRLSPLVRKMAREYGIDLRQVKGTGAGGRITKQDLEAYMSAQGARTMAQASVPPQPALPRTLPLRPRPRLPPCTRRRSLPAPMPRAEAPRARVEPMSVMRQRIAEHMVMSKRISAHVTTVHKTDMTKIAKMRERNKAEFQARYGYSLTFLPFVAKAAAEAIRHYPIVNASIEGTNIIYHNEINIGIAVALENGLIVPVIRNADEKNVVGLQRSIVDLSTRARSRQLKPDEVQGGTFSITNFGSFGSVFATPVINQPQVAILGVGRGGKNAGRGGRRDRDSLHRLSRAHIRSSADRRRAGRSVHRQGEIDSRELVRRSFVTL